MKFIIVNNDQFLLTWVLKGLAVVYKLATALIPPVMLSFLRVYCGGFKAEPGGHGPTPRTFGNPEGAPHLRKNGKEITGKHLNTPLRHNNFNEKELEE